MPSDVFDRMKSVVSPREAKVGLIAVLIYVTVYALEAPIRYGLSFVKLSEVILLRDLLILGPLAYIAFNQFFRRQVSFVLIAFIFIMIFQGGIFYLNYHTLAPVILGIKLFTNLLLGYFLGTSLVNPSPRVLRYMTFLFFLSCVGLIVEKLITQYPWVGMYTVIGGIQVPISLDWQSGEDFDRRVGGFTRISINAACVVPFLGIVAASGTPRFWLRLGAFLLIVVDVFFTTQKGALVAAALSSGCLLLPTGLRTVGLYGAVILGVLAQVILPFATNGMLMSEGTGNVYSASSFAARVLYTWPTSLSHIYQSSIGPFGLGLGGLGGPMRLLVSDALWMFADNMFIFVYGYFGIFALFYYWSILFALWKSVRLNVRITESALAVLCFFMWYGTVVTGFEDQMTSLAIGAALGGLLNVNPTPRPSTVSSAATSRVGVEV